MLFPESFILFQQEAFLTRSAIHAGFNALRKGNVDEERKGLLYSAFFQLSIGFERLFKIILVVDHMAKNDLAPMSDDELRTKYSHRIVKLYEGCIDLAKSHGIDTSSCVSKDDLEYQIIVFLNEFALSARYYNLSKLSSSAKSKDPISEWWRIVCLVIDNDVSLKKKDKIFEGSLNFVEMGGNTFTLMHGPNQQLMTSLDAITYPQLVDAAAPYLVWRAFRIIQPMYSILDKVVHNAHKIERSKNINYPMIPYLEEFFPFLLLNRRDVLLRKVWG